MCIEKSNGMPNFIPFHLVGSRLSLCFMAKVIAWPLMFSIAGHGIGRRRSDPAPSVSASGIGLSMWVASYSPFSDLSRTTAQPAVRTTSTFKPCLA